MEDRELLLKSNPEFDRLAFTVLAIEASAQKMGISPSEMRRRLDKVGLIKISTIPMSSVECFMTKNWNFTR